MGTRNFSSNYTIILDKELFERGGPGTNIKPDGKGGLEITIKAPAMQHAVEDRKTSGPAGAPTSSVLTIRFGSSN